jgi:hypothetical protein
MFTLDIHNLEERMQRYGFPSVIPPTAQVKVYDVEVLRGPEEVEGGWRNPWEMGFGTAVVFDYCADRYDFYGPDDRERLVGDLTGCYVVGFNSVRFDNHVLMHPARPTPDLVPWTNIDLLHDVVKARFGVCGVEAAENAVGVARVHDGSITLDGLAWGTLGLHKAGNGAHAAQLIRQGRWPEVFAYNLNDVRLTRKLYEFVCRYGYLIDRGGMRIPLEAPVAAGGAAW